VVVNYIREAQIAAGVPRFQVYDFTMYILARMLVLGLICKFLVRKLADHWFALVTLYLDTWLISVSPVD